MLFLFLLFILFLPMFTPVIHGGDGAGTFGYLHSFTYDNDLNLTNEYEHYKERYPYIKYHVDNTTGMGVSQYTIGTSMIWSGGYHITSLADIVFNLNLTG